MKRLIVALALATSPAAVAHTPPVTFTPEVESRAREVGKSLRCVVCQNQSIDDSAAEVARDMRRAVRERISAGDKDEQVFAYMVARYGDYVLLKPPFKAGTWVLWLGGPIVLIVAGGLLLIAARRRKPIPPAEPLSDEEQRRLNALLKN